MLQGNKNSARTTAHFRVYTQYNLVTWESFRNSRFSWNILFMAPRFCQTARNKH